MTMVCREFIVALHAGFEIVAPQLFVQIDLIEYLEIDASRVAAALAVLDTYGAVEIDDVGEERAVRVSKGMMP